LSILITSNQRSSGQQTSIYLDIMAPSSTIQRSSAHYPSLWSIFNFASDWTEDSRSPSPLSWRYRFFSPPQRPSLHL